MKLTRKKAIELCIELWMWCMETGEDKKDWPRWTEFKKIRNDCWFCEYSKNRLKYNGCKYCPYNENFAYMKTYSCESKRSPYFKWANADTPEDKKKYAKLFVKQIKKCI